MKRNLLIIFLFISLLTKAQVFSLDGSWQFRLAGSTNWMQAVVPGTVHTDLLANGKIPDPFYRDGEEKVQWVEKESWEYRKNFVLPASFVAGSKTYLHFEGLDIYATIILNGDSILTTQNMFLGYSVDVTERLKKGSNELKIIFSPAALIAQKAKEQWPIALPDNERVFVRKAQYSFGWDWGPRLVTAGIWRPVFLSKNARIHETKSAKNEVDLVVKKDSIGEAFYFTVKGKPTFIRGANWIPAESFLPRAKKEQRYQQLLAAAKEAGVNMLRVWGGGIYEDDVFYQLCDQFGIMVWQDFMFAGALYPANNEMLQNIESEVRYQVNRLRKYKCIVLWCGNNEIEEAWFNWGWQKSLGYTAADSARLWNDYQKIFHQLIPSIVKELDQRPYWPSSPSLGWGRDSAYKKGDVHYWGVWWGKEKVERYRDKVGRFVSEYGMQALPHIKTIASFTLPGERDTASKVMKVHQKHPFGYSNIKFYTENKFRQPKDFESLVTISQYMQADALQTAIEAHRRNKPATMGTLFWQWNDCWPVVSWSVIDYEGRKKAAFYAVKNLFKDRLVSSVYTDRSISLRLIDEQNRRGAYQVYLESLDGGYSRFIRNWDAAAGDSLVILFSELFPNNTYNSTNTFLKLVEKETIERRTQAFLLTDPKDLQLVKPRISFTIEGGSILLRSNVFAYGVHIDLPDGISPEDQYFHLLPGEMKRVRLKGALPLVKKNIIIRSLVDTY